MDFRINANLVKEGSFSINAKLVKEELKPVISVPLPKKCKPGLGLNVIVKTSARLSSCSDGFAVARMGDLYVRSRSHRALICMGVTSIIY